MNAPWKYPTRDPQFATGSSFVAWVSGSASRQSHSAAAYYVERRDAPEEFATETMQSEQNSTAPRAHIGAAIGVCEAVPVGSSVEIRTRDLNLFHLLTIDLPNSSSNGWLKSDGKLFANVDAKRKLAQVIEEKQLTVTAKRITDEKSSDGQKIKQIRVQARKASNR